MQKWIALPKKGAWTYRHEKAAVSGGFIWDGNDQSYIGEQHPETPWGCVVRKYRPPAPPRKGFGAAIGIMIGTYDEFGRPKKEVLNCKQTK